MNERGIKHMKRVIPDSTYKLIEAKLHNRQSIADEIDKWRFDIQYPETKQVVGSAGYISDPTANQAIKMSSPPKRIRDAMKWLGLIDNTREFCDTQKEKNRMPVK